MPSSRRNIDLYALYEIAVQSVDWELDFVERAYRDRHGKRPHTFREDFSSTAALATAWAQRHPENRSFAVDLDDEPLEWARRYRLPFAGEAGERVKLIRGDVRTPRKPLVQVACALNFSWWVFHERYQLSRYLRAAYEGLLPGGVLVMDAYGGHGSEKPLTEHRRRRGGRTPDGRRVGAFTYFWEHELVDAIERRLVAHIHFKLDDGPRIQKAFTYDWRMWTLAELKELAKEVGFKDFEVYTEVKNVMRLKKTLPNEESWIVSCALYR